MIQNILMTTDFSVCSRIAAELAFQLARICGATSHLLHATLTEFELGPFFEDTPYEETEILMEPESRVERGMDSLMEKLEVDATEVFKIQVRGITETGSIISYARENPIDLMVMGAHGRNPEERILGSVARRMIGSAPCPVLLAGEKESPGGNFKKILLPLDFACINPNLLAGACELASAFGGTLQLLQVVTDPDRVMEAILVTGKTRELLATMVPSQVTLEIGVAAGEVTGAIADFAQKHHSDLIYIPRARQDLMAMNRLVEGLLKKAKCPICVGPAQ